MTDIFQEVDEEIRKERYARLWKRYGAWVIGAAVALVLAVAGYQGWQAYQRDRAETAARAYADAMDKLESQGAEAARPALSKLADPSGAGYALIAAQRLAALQAAAGERAAAIATWTQVAQNDAAPRGLRDAATILAAMHRIEAGDTDGVRQDLAALAEGDGAFATTALELQAAAALKAGDRTAAIALLKRIADGAGARPDQRQRATQLLARLEG